MQSAFAGVLSSTQSWRRSSRPKRTVLVGPFWIGLLLLTIAVLTTAHPQNPESAIGAVLIIAAAWFPTFLWTTAKFSGLPIFPIFALTHTWTFGLPLLYEHPIVTLFEPTAQLYAAFSVTAFLVLSTLTWFWCRKQKTHPPQRCYLISRYNADFLFIGILVLTIIFTVSVNGWWLNISGPIYSIVRAVMLSIEALSCFVLSYRLGSGELRGILRIIFKVLLVLLVLVSLPPLEMVTSMGIVALSAFGYVSGGGKVPWVSFAAGVLLFAFLHMGKGEMRERYWGEEDQGPVQPTSYPAFFAEWTSASWDELLVVREGEEKDEKSIIERASLMQLLLYEQTLSSSVPFLYGDTYVIVPELMIPRILYPEKPTTHEGTYRLNIHYGFQTREQTETTTLGFGLVNEAYANFGLVGMALFAIGMGSYYGMIEKWAAGVPLLSFRGLLAVVVASYSFQTEFAAGVYAAALFQAMFPLIALCILIMKVRPNPLAPSQVQPARQPVFAMAS
jgi:hypothetical protein